MSRETFSNQNLNQMLLELWQPHYYHRRHRRPKLETLLRPLRNKRHPDIKGCLGLQDTYTKFRYVPGQAQALDQQALASSAHLSPWIQVWDNLIALMFRCPWIESDMHRHYIWRLERLT
jgi:hypothetical protein